VHIVLLNIRLTKGIKLLFEAVCVADAVVVLFWGNVLIILMCLSRKMSIIEQATKHFDEFILVKKIGSKNDNLA
jgi:hypothetical protein